jgi:hypothetical protein
MPRPRRGGGRSPDANDVIGIAPILEIGPLTREVAENVNPDGDGPYVERVAAYAGFSIAP